LLNAASTVLAASARLDVFVVGRRSLPPPPREARTRDHDRDDASLINTPS
jgi:hypothetical protein